MKSTYTVKISVNRSDKPDVSLDFTLEDIDRDHIMEPGYGAGGITAAVRQYEKFIPLAPPGSRRSLAGDPKTGTPVVRKRK